MNGSPSIMPDKINIQSIRDQFPTLAVKVNGKDLIYLDNAATSHKPLSVIEKVDNFYRFQNSNIHRGIHHLSDLATREFEAVRSKIKNFLNAERLEEVIFTKGTTEAINLVAYSFGKKYIKPGDEILLSGLEHHSNIVPWQLMAEERGAKIKVIPVDGTGTLQIELLPSLLSEKTKIVAIGHTSNAIGTINPLDEIIRQAHEVGAAVLVDGAQAVPHTSIDVIALDCDFFVFSGHKLFGPTGTGVLYGKAKWLNEMPPYHGGGDMIDKVTFEKTTWNTLPHKFEAGTPNIAGIIGLGAAVDYVNEIGYDFIEKQEKHLLNRGTELLESIPNLRIIGNAKHKTSVISFLGDNCHPSDLGTILDMDGIAIRTGHHCAQPLMDHFGIPGTARASFAFYNTIEEVESFAVSLDKALKMFN